MLVLVAWTNASLVKVKTDHNGKVEVFSLYMGKSNLVVEYDLKYRDYFSKVSGQEIKFTNPFIGLPFETNDKGFQMPLEPVNGIVKLDLYPYVLLVRVKEFYIDTITILRDGRELDCIDSGRDWGSTNLIMKSDPDTKGVF